MENYDKVLRAYKKRQVALQRRVSAEHGVNKRLTLLLRQVENSLSEGLLKETIQHELEMLKYKYY